MPTNTFKNIILFDDDNWESLLPLTFTKPICELRIGILTIREKWEKHLKASATSFITQDFLSEKYPIHIDNDNIIINSTILPTPKLIKLIFQLDANEAILDGDELLAARLTKEQFERLLSERGMSELQGVDISKEIDVVKRILRPNDIFTYNDSEIRVDFDLLTKDRISQSLSSTNTLLGDGDLFIEPGVSIESAILNTSKGPIYIGKDGIVMEGSMIRGPFAMCKNAVVKMGAKIYGATTIGPYCKVGGEVSNSVLIGYSNKGHDGFLGNSVIGEWCNLGADTNVSNLKNNYDNVKLWSYEEKKFIQTNLQFCGLIMGDHSKTAINTMINTGTVVGVATNIFGSNFPRNYIPSYSWGGASGFKTHMMDKALKTARIVMKRRDIDLSEQDSKIFEHVFYMTSKYRTWE
ncbi:MAG: GlmU family protein [Saprospiraceae bacterium]